MFSKSPTLGLSATITPAVLEEVKSVLKFQNTNLEIVSALPDRPNIYLQVVHQKTYDYEKDLVWLLNGIRHHKQSYPKTLVYCQTVYQVGNIYEWMISCLGSDAFLPNCLDKPKDRFISMYTADISPRLQEYTLETFRQPNCTMRILICTVAFGMGVSIDDVRQVSKC